MVIQSEAPISVPMRAWISSSVAMGMAAALGRGSSARKPASGLARRRVGHDERAVGGGGVGRLGRVGEGHLALDQRVEQAMMIAALCRASVSGSFDLSS